MTREYNFLATGIGSLPHTDVKKAVDLVLTYCPHMPFWPQLPRRSKKEDMLVQFNQGVPCLKEIDSGLVFDEEAYRDNRQLEEFLGKIVDGDVDFFKIDPSYAAGLQEFNNRLESSDLREINFIKCHVTGPFTFAGSIKDRNGRALIHNEVMMDAIVKALAMKAKWQIRGFKKFNKPIIVFFDEPYLAAFGSAFTPIERKDVVRVLGEMLGEVKKEGVDTGIHCCGNTDWSMFLEMAELDIINFDAFGFFERFALYTDEINKFLTRGGAICWGIVPTFDFDWKINAADLAETLKGHLNVLLRTGVNEKQLIRQSLLSPACGLGSLGEKEAEAILKLLSETSSSLRSV